MNNHTLVNVFDGLSFAPAPPGTLVRVTLDVFSGGNIIWYEKQERTPGEGYLVWRRIPEPSNERLLMQTSLGEPRVMNVLESEFLSGWSLREADSRWGKVARVWI